MRLRHVRASLKTDPEWQWWKDFACAALQGLLANPDLHTSREHTVSAAAGYADLMVHLACTRMLEEQPDPAQGVRIGE